MDITMKAKSQLTKVRMELAWALTESGNNVGEIVNGRGPNPKPKDNWNPNTAIPLTIRPKSNVCDTAKINKDNAAPEHAIIQIFFVPR